jgi:hypothetical protein
MFRDVSRSVLTLLMRLQLQQGKSAAALTTCDTLLRPELLPRDPTSFWRCLLHAHAHLVSNTPSVALSMVQTSLRLWSKEQAAQAHRMVTVYEELLTLKYECAFCFFFFLMRKVKLRCVCGWMKAFKSEFITPTQSCG